MTKTLALLAVGILLGSTVLAAPDPWRIKVTDYDPTVPYVDGDWIGEVVVDPSVGTWTAAGGRFRVYWWFGDTYGSSTGAASYSAATGAISWGAVTATSWEGWGIMGPTDVLRVGAGAYKSWRWDFEYHGQDIRYATSTDGVNFSIQTRTTIYGPTTTSTGTYGLNPYRSTGGVYLAQHRNSGANYQNAGGKGIATSELGETVWYNIDTNFPSPGVGGSPYLDGDPINEPHNGPGYVMWDSNNYTKINRACDGNLMATQGAMNYNSFPGWDFQKDSRGVGLNIGTAGELAGGDHYVWLADPNNDNTVGIGNSLLSAIGRAGLGGPSLRASEVSAGWWTGWPTKTLPIGKFENQPATQFLMLYDAMWDTDSSGDGVTSYDTFGVGRAKLLLTRNNADLNFDGTVNFSDVSIFSGAFGSTSGGPGYSADADLNKDGKVNFLDAALVSGRYGSDCSYGQ